MLAISRFLVRSCAHARTKNHPSLAQKTTDPQIAPQAGGLLQNWLGCYVLYS